MSEFQTKKESLTNYRIVDCDNPELNDGQIKVKVDRFAFTANNITYAVLGERLKYWAFFPAHGDDASDWGIIPVWGFADVVESNAEGLPVGDRLFGYFPPANTLIMTPSRINNGSFIDATEHRTPLPVSYNLYRRVLSEPGYDRASDDVRMLLFVLHLTSFCIHDMLESNDWFGAKQIVIISASSKTSTGLACGLQDDSQSPNVIGLTSSRNLDLVDSMQVYDQVLSYDTLEHIDANLPTVIIDMSANTAVLSQLHTHLGDNMRFTSNVGLTHWDEPQQAEGIIRERSEMFFAPGYIQQRIQDWGRDKFDEKSTSYVANTTAKSCQWLTIKELDGLAGLSEMYQSVCDGTAAANEGLVVRM